jgi:hypothetical protein
MQIFNENYDGDSDFGVCGIWRIDGMGNQRFENFKDMTDFATKLFAALVERLYERDVIESFAEKELFLERPRDTLQEVFAKTDWKGPQIVEIVTTSDQPGDKYMKELVQKHSWQSFSSKGSAMNSKNDITIYLTTVDGLKADLLKILPKPIPAPKTPPARITHKGK